MLFLLTGTPNHDTLADPNDFSKKMQCIALKGHHTIINLLAADNNPFLNFYRAEDQSKWFGVVTADSVDDLRQEIIEPNWDFFSLFRLESTRLFEVDTSSSDTVATETIFVFGTATKDGMDGSGGWNPDNFDIADCD